MTLFRKCEMRPTLPARGLRQTFIWNKKYEGAL